jgi:hypothetical protein
MKKRWQALVFLSAIVGLGAGPRQGPELDTVMREKLVHSQKILEAVVTSDWRGLEAHSRELERLTRDPRWAVLNYPEYIRHSSAFRRSIQDLHTAAVQRDLEKAPQAYVAMTMRCVECHRYLARARIAQ